MMTWAIPKLTWWEVVLYLLSATIIGCLVWVLS
jgi:hypothetical protein